MSPLFDRATLLFEQGRPELAERELRQVLAEAPEAPAAHALLALCLAEREKLQEATEAAKKAIHFGPDLPFSHFAWARVLFRRQRHDEALGAVGEALRLDPTNVPAWGLQSAIRHAKGDWKGALESAERGLELDAEDGTCTNLRAMALTQLGRRDEAGEAIEGALERDPENPVTHANRGWALLHEAKPEPALEHFREALRLDPESEWARRGIIEAMKGRYWVYGLFLRYFLWMSRLSSKAQWLVILGLWGGSRLLRSVSKTNPELAPWITPLLVVYTLFAIGTWIAGPLFNLVLRLSRFGRMLLSREEILESNWIGGLLLAALAAFGFFLVTGNDLGFLGAIGFLLLLPPIAATFQCDAGWPRRLMAGYSILLGVLAAATMVALGLAAQDPKLGKTAEAMAMAFLIGAIASQWVGIGLSQVVARR